jgi:hypothetical protein
MILLLSSIFLAKPRYVIEAILKTVELLFMETQITLHTNLVKKCAKTATQ